MAADKIKIKEDVDKVSDEALDQVRNLLDAALLVEPENALAEQAFQQVFDEWKLNKAVFIKVTIASRVGATFTLIVTTSLTPLTGFTPAKRWLFNWFNFRRE